MKKVKQTRIAISLEELNDTEEMEEQDYDEDMNIDSEGIKHDDDIKEENDDDDYEVMDVEMKNTFEIEDNATEDMNMNVDNDDSQMEMKKYESIEENPEVENSSESVRSMEYSKAAELSKQHEIVDLKLNMSIDNKTEVEETVGTPVRACVGSEQGDRAN